jgi:plasmid maintenance system antidote protein VapI
MEKPNKPSTMTETLKQAIAESGISHRALGKATGIERTSITRFMLGERSLRLDKADKIAAYFGLILVAETRNR